MQNQSSSAKLTSPIKSLKTEEDSFLVSIYVYSLEYERNLQPKTIEESDKCRSFMVLTLVCHKHEYPRMKNFMYTPKKPLFNLSVSIFICASILHSLLTTSYNTHISLAKEPQLSISIS